jgi:hypothetical protein
MHVLDLTPRCRIVADIDPEPENPRTTDLTPVGVFCPLDNWMDRTPELYRFPGNISRAHETFNTFDFYAQDRVARWAWAFFGIHVHFDGVRYWFVDAAAYRALISEDLSRDRQIECVDRARGEWHRYAADPAWRVHLERRATFRRATKKWNTSLNDLIHVWERVSEPIGSLYLDSDFNLELACVAQENWSADLQPAERARIESVIDEGRALS